MKSQEKKLQTALVYMYFSLRGAVYSPIISIICRPLCICREEKGRNRMCEDRQQGAVSLLLLCMLMAVMVFSFGLLYFIRAGQEAN